MVLSTSRVYMKPGLQREHHQSPSLLSAASVSRRSTSTAALCQTSEPRTAKLRHRNNSDTYTPSALCDCDSSGGKVPVLEASRLHAQTLPTADCQQLVPSDKPLNHSVTREAGVARASGNPPFIQNAAAPQQQSSGNRQQERIALQQRQPAAQASGRRVGTAMHNDADSTQGKPIKVWAMLPLDTVNSDGIFRYAAAPWFAQALNLLAASGVYGVAVDLWWGAVERGPKQYNWTGYQQLFELVKQAGLKIQSVLSFHACGGNVGDTAQIPLPGWVLQCGGADPDLFFTDRPRHNGYGQRNREYLSIWADDAPGVLCGRTPMQCYEDFMTSFRDTFYQDLGCSIEEVVIGAGPCGELRMPAYVEANGWRFPGIGEFQCYDRRALASLAQAAHDAGHPEWGYSGPHDAGSYTSSPEQTGFFSHEGSWDTAYGRFFLNWYSSSLLKHGDRLLSMASTVFAAKLNVRTSNAGIDRLLDSSPLEQGMAAKGNNASATAGSSAISSFDVRSMQLRQPVAGMHPMSGPASDGTCGDMDVEQSEASLSSIVTDMMTITDCRVSPNAVGLGASRFRYASGSTIADSDTSVSTNVSLRMDFYNSISSLSTEYTAASVSPFLDAGALGTDGDDVSEMGTSCTGADAPADDADDLYQRDLEFPYVDSRRRSADLPQIASPSGTMTLTLKVPGIHWWFRSRAHAAELTAGYYNTDRRDGYEAIVQMCSKYRANLTLTCVEMCDAQHPGDAMCGPEGLLRHIRALAARHNVPLCGENALPIFLENGVDCTALDRIVANTRAWHKGMWSGQMAMGNIVSMARQMAETRSAQYNLYQGGLHQGYGQQGHGAIHRLPEQAAEPACEVLPAFRSFTFLRLGPELLQHAYQGPWMRFMYRMQQGGHLSC